MNVMTTITRPGLLPVCFLSKCSLTQCSCVTHGELDVITGQPLNMPEHEVLSHNQDYWYRVYPYRPHPNEIKVWWLQKNGANPPPFFINQCVDLARGFNVATMPWLNWTQYFHPDCPCGEFKHVQDWLLHSTDVFYSGLAALGEAGVGQAKAAIL
jgi:hypothetical protein